MRSIAEAMILGLKAGMNLNILTEIMKKSTSNCWSLEKSNPVPNINETSPSSRSYENGFAINLALKDL